MSMLTTSWTAWPMPRQPVRRFTVDEYHRMMETGILTEDDPVELLEGWIVQKMAHNPPHDATIGKAGRLLTRLLPSDLIVRTQSSITTPNSEPEPDLAVVPGPDDLYFGRHPIPAEVALLIEVADSTLSRDRGEKARLYARAGITCYWIINLPDRQVEVYTDPTGAVSSPQYRQRQDFRPGDSVPLVIAGQTAGHVAVNDILPPP